MDGGALYDVRKALGRNQISGQHQGLYLKVAFAVENVKEAARNLGWGLGLHLKPSTQGLHCDSHSITVIMEAQSPRHIWGMLPLLLPKLVVAVFKDERICRAEIYSLF